MLSTIGDAIREWMMFSPIFGVSYPMSKSYCNLHVFFYDEFHLGKEGDGLSQVICVRNGWGTRVVLPKEHLRKTLLCCCLGKVRRR
jgi:hypothetical protein